MAWIRLALVAAAVAVAGAARADEPGAEAVYRSLKLALNAGDIGGAMAQLADDVEVVAGPGCTPASPCRGAHAARFGFVAYAARLQISTRAAAVQAVPGGYRARVELRWPGLADLGVERIVGVDEFRVEGGRIARLVFQPDLSDPPTARLMQRPAGQALARSTP